MTLVEQHWDIRPIKKIPAQYRVIVGERSNGKTYGVLKYCLEEFWDHRKQTGYVRRWPDDIKMRKMQQLFEALSRKGEVTKITNGAYNGIRYRHGKFFLIATNGEDCVEYEEPFMYTFSISAMEHDKSISYPGIKIVMFDEFISRQAYIPDEFALFMNLLSSIIRERDDVEIWMLGNTVTKECPYFREMGLRHVYKQEPGTIDTYSYKKNGQELLIAVEYTKNLAAKASDKYFIFDNPKMEMITGGAWELAIYPHLFEKYTPQQVLLVFFVEYRNTILQCEVIEGESDVFIFCHLKTTPLKLREDDLIFSPEPKASRNYVIDISKPTIKITQKLYRMIVNERICFQDNEVGELFNDYLKWCRAHQTIKR